jgi:protein TonB
MFETASFGMRALLASALVHGTIVAVVATEVHLAPPREPPPVTLLDVLSEPPPLVVAAPPELPTLLPVAAPTLTPRPRTASVPSPPSAPRSVAPAKDAKPVAAAPPETVTGPATAPPSCTMAMPVITSGTGGGGSAPTPSARATREAKVLDESGASALADRVYGPSPSYPLEAQRARVEADIPLLILVDTTGRVVDVRIERRAGYGLDEAAEKAVRQWTFRPRRVDGEPVAVRVQWTMQFHLD